VVAISRALFPTSIDNSGDSFKTIKAQRKARKIQEPDEEIEE
jgi:hypothetical protein